MEGREEEWIEGRKEERREGGTDRRKEGRKPFPQFRGLNGILL